MKTLSLVRRAEGMDRTEFGDALLAWSREAATATGVEGWVTNLVDIPAKDAGLRPGGEPAFDAAIEVWTADRMDPQPLITPPSSLAKQFDTYEVEEREKKAYVRDWALGERSPGLKSFYLALRNPAMTHAQYSEYWSEKHAPLALRIHIGMWRYMQNHVTRALPGASTPWDGFALLHFRTADDFRERFYINEAGRQAIAEDVAKFSGSVGGKRLLTSEWVLK